IQKRSCPDAAGDAAKFLLQIKNIAYDVSDDIGKQIEDTLNNVSVFCSAAILYNSLAAETLLKPSCDLPVSGGFFTYFSG
ncbi:hypothetical protein M1466_01155, partial [Candidatus Dependentiae bacterium]|nr:hypothetical protein [Candidatus Dependentiae bacterium]